MAFPSRDILVFPVGAGGDIYVADTASEPVGDVNLTPGTGSLSLSGGEVKLETLVRPGAGSLSLVGYISKLELAITFITPATGRLSLVGTAPSFPPPPLPPLQAGGGAQFTQPRRLPFWERRVVVGSGVFVVSPALVTVSGGVEEDELLGEENRVLELL